MRSWALPSRDTYFAEALAADPRGFEIDHLLRAIPFCRRRRTAIDGGAHVGTWSAELAKAFDRVYAFEPATDTYHCLVANVSEMQNVFPSRLALGEADGAVAIRDDPMRKGNTGARMVAKGEGAELFPIDKLALIDLDFLKLDVEGYELFALRGAAATLRRCKPVVVIEAKRFFPERFGAHYMAASEYLERLGYREVARERNDRVFAMADSS